MPTELERRLGDAFHDDAARARLVNPDRPADPGGRPLSVARPASRSPWRAVAVAAAVALVVATGVTVTRNRDGGTEVTTTPGPTELFPGLPPDSTMRLPPGPIGAPDGPGGTWTGTELIVWNKPFSPDDSLPPEGAAFNPETSTWRTIAPAPIDSGPVVAWTGSEMIVWGGRDTDGAAYDPEADTWRRLPEAPIAVRDVATAVWTGNELIVLSDVHSGGEPRAVEAAAYDPATDEWRALAETHGDLTSPPVWTGTTVLTVLDASTVTSAANDGRLRRLARYDLRTDTWHIDADACYASLVGVPDTDGVTRTVLALPVEPGEPVDLLDDGGNRISSLPAVPRDPAASTTYADGIWLGEEAVFWIELGAPLLVGHAEAWALDPATGTWRPLPDDVDAVANDRWPAAAVGDVLLASDGAGGIAYRAPT